MIRGKQGASSALQIVSEGIRKCETLEDLFQFQCELERRKQDAKAELTKGNAPNAYLAAFHNSLGYGISAVASLLQLNEASDDQNR